MIAAKMGHMDMVNTLIEHGANTEITNKVVIVHDHLTYLHLYAVSDFIVTFYFIITHN